MNRNNRDPSAVSVVLPTYRRGPVLLQTLRHLAELPDPPGEILVMDQTGEYPEDVQRTLQALEQAGQIRRLRLPYPSIPRAMNTGLREARGRIVLFLDDDILPDPGLIGAHAAAYQRDPEAWAVAGRVLQPEEGDGQGGRCMEPVLRTGSGLRQDLDFRFNGVSPAWVTNVMAGNLSVLREKALASGGFDENFIPPVSYRFETEFAKRLIAAGGRIRFEPAASIRHLRAPCGGTRSRGSHLTSASPVHGVGDYYYALRCGRRWERVAYMARRPLREVCTRFHLRHPWYIPVKVAGELRALWWAFRLYRAGPKRLQRSLDPQPPECDDPKEFYERQYAGYRYASYASPEAHPFHTTLRELLARYGRKDGTWLEVGCGRGFLQDVVEDYTGVDIAETVSVFLRKPFQCAPAEHLPFEDNHFDGAWSYAVLEHVNAPEPSLSEMRRVLKPGGLLILSPAWPCRPWAGQGYAWKPFQELSAPDRVRKARIPLRGSVVVRIAGLFPRRILRMCLYGLRRKPTSFRCRPLEADFSDYRVVDADARHSMDPFEAILWFRSRGDRVLSHPGWIRALFVRTGPLVVEVMK